MSNSFSPFDAGKSSDEMPGTRPSALGSVVSTAAYRKETTASDDVRSIELQASMEQARTLAATLELLSELDTCSTVQAASERLVARLREHCEASNVLVLWKRQTREDYELTARIEGQEPIIESKDDHRKLLAATEEIVGRDSVTVWPSEQPDQEYALLAVAQFANSISVARVTAVSLIDETESPRGVLMVFDASSPSIQLMRLLGSSVGLKLTGLEQLQPGQLESCVRESRAWLAAQKRTLLLTSAILLLAVMLLPIRYRIGTELELQPVEQRFVAVPFDAPLERVFVRPGDVVERDDLLATINPREIEFQLAGTRAELSRAIQERKRFLSEHDFAGSQLAEFESEKLRLDKELLEYQRENLEIRSPIGGIVVSGDLEPSEGMPMTRGETLFEIAPLGECSVELLIPEEDFAHVRVGMNVAFYVHAYPGTKLEGSIERVHPRAELRDHVNVYVAELKLNDPDQRMRPGMRGRAKIIGDRHTLCWNLFHKAYHASYRFLGW